jgi:hypothetical protein
VHRLPLLMLFALAVAACGGSKETKTTSTTSAPPTLQAFVAAGNKVCQDTDKKIMSIGRLTRDPRGWGRTYAAAKAGVVAMQRVTPPPDRARAFNLMLRYANALALSMQEVHDALARKNIDVAAAAQLAAGRIQDKVHEQAKAVGLTFCQQPLTNWPA